MLRARPTHALARHRDTWLLVVITRAIVRALARFALGLLEAPIIAIRWSGQQVVLIHWVRNWPLEVIVRRLDRDLLAVLGSQEVLVDGSSESLYLILGGRNSARLARCNGTATIIAHQLYPLDLVIDSEFCRRR